jgi:Cd2+/Zn2+-exporting ATPase
MVEAREIKIPILCSDKNCSRCNQKLLSALLNIKGVEKVKIDSLRSVATLTYDPNVLSYEYVDKQVKQIGCKLAKNYAHVTLDLTGLDCPDCAVKLEKAVNKKDGVIWTSVNFAASTIGVEFERHKVSDSDIISIIKGFGYDVVKPEQFKEPWWIREHKLILTSTSGLFLVIGYLLSLLTKTVVVSDLFYLMAIAIGGYYIVRSAIYALSTFTLDMNVLLVLAVIGAIAINQWLEAALVVFLFASGNALEYRAMSKARKAIHSLIELSPKQAIVRTAKGDKFTPIEKVKVGQVVVIKPGAKIPLDGKVVQGSSFLDESAITGESLPVEKTVGSSVLAGSINQTGALLVEVKKAAKDSTLSRIQALVEEAQNQKAPTQIFAEKFGKYYTPVIIGASLLIAIIPPLLLAKPFKPWIYRSLVLLVVSCPCALVISTPVAIVSAIGRAAKNGILVKGGAHLESAGLISALAFDKTGTLTIGKPAVTEIITFNSLNKEEALKIAAALEHYSEHPLAKAVIKAANSSRRLAKVSHFKTFPGSGIKGFIDNQLYFLGSHRFFREQELPLKSSFKQIKKLELEGKTLLFLGTKEKLLAVIAVSDQLRPETQEAINKLRHCGIKKLVMLTGDNKYTAKTIAKSIGIDEYYAELLPEDKLKIVNDLKDKYGFVAMVGDGINDAPALATASVGIAMGAAGTDVALETADMTLMTDNLNKLCETIILSKKTSRAIYQNIIFSLAVVGILVVSTVFGFLTLSLGILGHEGSALLVIANGMRLLKTRIV